MLRLQPGRACAVSFLAAILLAGSALAGPSGAKAGSLYENHWFGARSLQLGDRGADVKTLNWALRSQALGTPYAGDFDAQTDWAVRHLQGSRGLRADGVVTRTTRKAIASGMLRQRATWYGPGLWGNRTACGVKLTKRTIGVAHKKLPCGTRVAFAHEGRWLRAKVIDRGPFRKGYRWDLTSKLAHQLGVREAGTATVKAGVAP